MRQANIVSFDDAKRASRNRRAPAPAPYRSRGFADFDYTFSDDASDSWMNASASADGSHADEHQSEEPRQSKKESWFSKFKRDRAKGKAGRAFTKQYGDTSSSASQSGPRAAVYKGEMGSKHRRAARMQESASPHAPKGRSAFGVGAGIASSPKFIAVAAAAACVALSCVFLYPSAQQLYVSARENDRLQAEYDAVAARNLAIQHEVDALNTVTGIEDRAREEFGWSYAGEYAVTVQGLDVSEEASTFAANIVPGSVEMPETWYSKLLDPFFGVE